MLELELETLFAMMSRNISHHFIWYFVYIKYAVLSASELHTSVFPGPSTCVKNVFCTCRKTLGPG